MSDLIIFNLFLVLIISVWDMKFKKIPNAFIFIGIVYIYIYRIIDTGWATVWENSISLFIGFVCLFVLWGVIAAGDVKLLIYISLLVGVIQAWKIFFISTLVLLVFYLMKNPKKTAKRLKLTLYRYIYQIGVSELQKTNVIVYSPFIAVAFLINFYI